MEAKLQVDTFYSTQEHGLVKLKAIAEEKCTVEKVSKDHQVFELKITDLSQTMRILVNASTNDED